MAVVFRAFDPVLEREIALKVLPSYETEDPTFVERFRNEARSVAGLSHPSIVRVHDFGEDKGFIYIVMELLAGGTLKDRVGAKLTLARCLDLLRPLAEALDYAHGQGVIHRDIKPSNVLLTEAGEPVLCDFGIAQILQQSPSLTLTGAAIGTPEYMAPEQALGRSPDHRSDLYALGVIAYQMLVGQTPFRLDNPNDVLMAHIHTAAPAPRSLDPTTDPSLEAALLKALAKDPGERYQSAGEFIGALAGTSQATGTATAVERPGPSPPTAFAEGPAPEILQPTAAVSELAVTASTPVGSAWTRWRMPAGVILGIAVAAAVGIGIWLATGDDDTPTSAAEPAPTLVPSPAPTQAPTQAPAPPVAAAAEAAPLDLDSAVEQAFQRTSAIRGLEPVQEMRWQLVSRDELTQRQGHNLARAKEQFNTQQALLEVLGLIPRGLQLFDLAMGLFTQQGLGFYDTHNEELYIVREAADSQVRMARHLAKEYVHALQQEHFNISQKEDEARDSFEASLVLRAVIEADARAVQAEYALAHLTPEQYREFITSGAAVGSDNPLFQRAPYALRRLFDFAFTDGAALMEAVLAKGGRAAVDDLLAELPASTEQILHPEKYFASEPVVAVSLPDLTEALGDGWAEDVSDVLGEFFLRTFLETETDEHATRAAASWGGDRFSVLESPDGDKSLVMLIAWDTVADASEFFEVATTETVIQEKGYVGINRDRVLLIIGPSEASVSAIQAQFPDF